MNSSYSVIATSNGVTTYRPKTGTDARPGLRSCFCHGIVAPVSSGSPYSSGTPGRNGRSLTFVSWFGSGGPQLGGQSVLPAWNFVTAGNGIKVPAIGDARDPSSADCVLGRFAYAVYDTSGLLDANVAGHPDTASAEAPYRSSTAYADIGSLGLDANAAVGWRNVATGSSASFGEWATGVPRLSGTSDLSALAAARSGHLSAAKGDNAVFSRRDLLRNPHFAGQPCTSRTFSAR